MLLDFWSLFCCDLVPTRLALGTLLFMVAATAMHGGMQPCPLLSPSPARARVSTHFATTTCKNLGQADPKGCIFFPSLFTNHQNCYACNSWGLPALLRKQQVTHWRAQPVPSHLWVTEKKLSAAPSAASDPLVPAEPAPCPPQIVSCIPCSPPTTTSSRDFSAGYLRIRPLE